jgi:pilus assembly protein CpaC
VDSESSIRRVSVARPETADVLVVSPRQILVIGKSPGTTTLIYWSEEEISTTLDILVGINLDKVREELQKIAPNESFEVSFSGETIVLTGSVSDNAVQNRLLDGAKAHAKNVVNLLKVNKLDQILLQIRVSEVDRSQAKELGLNMLFEGNTLRGSVSPGNAFSPFFGALRGSATTDTGPNTSFSDAMNLFVAKPGEFPAFAAFLRVLQDRGALKTLAEPNLVVANGAEGKFLVGGEFPVVYQTSAGGSSSFAVNYKEYGIRLSFQPKIESNGEINLKVSQEVSDLDFANAVVLSGFRIPALKTRRAESGVQLSDGQTFVLAGLIDNKISKEVTQIPLLGDIPILGALFRNTRYSSTETELMVMVTPKIVRPLNRDEIPALPTERMDPKETSPNLLLSK